MLPISLGEIQTATGGRLCGDAGTVISSVFVNTRDAVKGGLYIAIAGERVDGHTFVRQMLDAGCFCVVDNEEYHFPGTVLVANSKRAVYDIAMYYRVNKVPGVKVIAITGSVAKTTVKDMTGLVVSSAYNAAVTRGNNNGVIGLPLSVLRIEKENEYAVLELGISELGEMELLAPLAKPFLSIITVIGSSHMQAFGSREGIRREKLKVLAGEPEGNPVLLDGDSADELALAAKLKHRAVYCAVGNDKADFHAENIETFEGGSEYDAVWQSGTARTRIKVPAEGIHNIKNSLYAFAAGIICGVTPESAAAAIARFAPTGDRQHIYTVRGITVIADCYNASPESMKASLGVMATKEGRKFAVLGDMLELGTRSDELHKEIAVLAAKTADTVIFVGDKAGMCEKAAEPYGKTVLTFGYDAESKRKAAVNITNTLRAGDVILFKGSRMIGLDTIIKDAELI